MVETRSKRKPDSTSELPKPPAKKVAKAEKPAAAKPVKKEKEAVKPAPKVDEKAKPTKKGPPVEGDAVTLEGFGGEVKTHEGTSVTLKSLLEKSKSGVVLFTYPKASTPGCTLH
jgi:thioredoxin-dependent peroxiredoxin